MISQTPSPLALGGRIVSEFECPWDDWKAYTREFNAAVEDRRAGRSPRVRPGQAPDRPLWHPDRGYRAGWVEG